MYSFEYSLITIKNRLSPEVFSCRYRVDAGCIDDIKVKVSLNHPDPHTNKNLSNPAPYSSVIIDHYGCGENHSSRNRSLDTLQCQAQSMFSASSSSLSLSSLREESKPCARSALEDVVMMSGMAVVSNLVGARENAGDQYCVKKLRESGR